MRRIVITRVQVWDEEVPDDVTDLEAFIDLVMADSAPDYDDTEVEEVYPQVTKIRG